MDIDGHGAMRSWAAGGIRWLGIPVASRKSKKRLLYGHYSIAKGRLTFFTESFGGYFDVFD